MGLTESLFDQRKVKMAVLTKHLVYLGMRGCTGEELNARIDAFGKGLTDEDLEGCFDAARSQMDEIAKQEKEEKSNG
jgi:hypothetical protein